MKKFSWVLLLLLTASSANAMGKKKPLTPAPSELLLTSLASLDSDSAMQLVAELTAPMSIPAKSGQPAFQNGTQYASLEELLVKGDPQQSYCMISLRGASDTERTFEKNREIKIDAVQGQEGMVLLFAFGADQMDPDFFGIACVPTGFANGSQGPVKVEDLNRAFGNQLTLMLEQR